MCSKRMEKLPKVSIIIPVYNAEKYIEKCLNSVVGQTYHNLEIIIVNDGSKDKTWEIIGQLAAQDDHYIGISQSRNRGHQNAVLAGLMEAKDRADITISIDCDGQDDITAMEAMVDEYHNGCEVVYGVRSKRDTDTFFKRFTAEGFYKLLNWMGA